MEIATWESIWKSILIVLLMAQPLIHWFYARQLRKRDYQIDTLKKSLIDLKAKWNEVERRRAFRIELLDQECEFELIGFGDKMLEPLKYKKGKGKIKDISYSGMKLSCKLDFPVRKKIFLRLHFVLYDEEFSLKGKIVRKEERMDDIFYGIEFIELDHQDQQRFYQVIRKLELERKKK